MNHRVAPVALLALTTTMTVFACGGADLTKSARHSVTSSKAGTDGDPCAPGNAKSADEDPNAECANRTEYHVPDLTKPASVPGGGTKTQNLRPLDQPAAAVAATKPSCSGNGAGIATCGPNGDDSCCRVASVPPGEAGATLKITKAFDLGVYEVTAGRLEKMVDALGGDLRGAAQAGKLPGFDVANADKLPASRDNVDEELGPACAFRGDPRNYGARSWWSEDVEDAVADIMSDDNDRAADIRKDATRDRMRAKPANCVSYYMAAAFCAWDGGRLPTDAEWIYTALGGSELRAYAWGAGKTGNRLVTDLNVSQNGGQGEAAFTWPEDFPYFDNGMNAYHIAPPGRKPDGVGRWGHHDLAGNVLEWTADITGPGAGIIRGGSWEGHPAENASSAFVNYSLTRTYGSLGFRCAYGDAQPPPPPPPPPPPALDKVAVHAALYELRGDWLLTRTVGEGAPTWVEKGVQFSALGSPPADGTPVAPIHRCRMLGSQTHFLSNDAACEGQIVEGPLAYVFAGQAAGTVPLYRCYAPGAGVHITTARPADCVAPFWQVEGTQGFAFAP